ncbi:MAG: minor capsid protein [Methanosarcina sp.]|nr:minor capsid protein [Methanosarcina sp.]
MLLDSPQILAIESRFISLFDRTFRKGVKGQAGPALKNSVKKQFKSATYKKQLDQIIDDLYLETIKQTDKLIKKSLKADLQRSHIFNVLNLAGANTQDDYLMLTEEAVNQSANLSEQITDSIIKVLKEEAIYQEGPDKLARRVLELWGGEKYRADRWARTFSADVAVNTTLYRYTQRGIENCQFYALIDERTSSQCRALHGTIFRSDSNDTRRYHPPLHYHCRSTLLPCPITMEIDDDSRFENRDFTKPLTQDLNPAEEGIDSDIIKKTFKNIEKFKDDYAIPQYILDEDIEKRLIKLGVGVEA